MNLLQRISLCLLKLAVHKRPRFTSARNSVSTPLGLKAYRDVNTHVKLEAGVERARTRCYVPRGDE